MTFCHNYFFFVSQFHVKYAYAVSKTVTSFMQFQKNCHQFHVQFQKKRSLLSLVVVKPSVILQKKTRLSGVNLKACKKTFFRVAKFWNSCRFFFFFQNLSKFFFPDFFSNLQFWIDFLCSIFFRFLQIYGTTVDFIKLKWNWQRFHWNYLKLFETICNCHSFTETGCKKSSYWHKIS